MGFSLLEVIGVLAVLAILAMALVPVAIHGYDRAARERESRALETLCEGLRTCILRSQSIPHATNFAPVIADEIGWELSAVLTNPRKQTRAFLIDPAVTATLPIPFAQTYQGVTATLQPGLGVLFISSTGQPLPPAVTTGFATSSAAFSNIWNTADGAIPSGWSWSGRAEDLRIVRLDLESLFIPLILNYDTYTVSVTNQGRFTIGGSTTNVLPAVPAYSASYLRGSTLGLHHHSATTNSLQVQEVLQHPMSFVYERDAWRGHLFLGRGLRLTSGLDLQAAHDLFISSPLNSNAKGNPQATPTLVVTAVSNFLNAYIAWNTAGYPSSGATYNAVKSAQTEVGTVSVDLLHKPNR